MILDRFRRKKTRLGSGVYRLARDKDTPTGRTRHLSRLVMLLVFAVVVALLTERATPPVEDQAYEIDAEPIARETVQAEFWFETVDLGLTLEAREAAAAKVPDSYRVTADKVAVQLRRFENRVTALRAAQPATEQILRKALLASTRNQDVAPVIRAALQAPVKDLKQQPEFEGVTDESDLTVWLLPRADSIPKRQFEAAGNATGEQVTALLEPEGGAFVFDAIDLLETLVQEPLRYVLTYGIVDPAERGPTLLSRLLILREAPVGDLKHSEEVTLAQVPTPARALDTLRNRVLEVGKALAAEHPDDTRDWSKLQNAAIELAKLDLAETLVFDHVATEGSREAARSATAEVMKAIRPFEVIQRGGEPWTPQSRSDTKTYWSKKRSGQEPAAGVLGSILSHMLFTVLALGVLVRYTR
ncbi:MAG: hypothetical protein HY706_13660, partial [Candidatus Hydrogenedentes bacterium]|nr:hypothetical protein [Candidatus Hydrogenedentota bacterium]